MPQGRTAWVSLRLLLALKFFTHWGLFIDRDSIGTAHQRPMHSQQSLPSRAFYPAPVLEDGLSGVSIAIRMSSSWATRMVDKAHGTWQVDGPIACARVSPFSGGVHSECSLTSSPCVSRPGSWIHQIASLCLVVYESVCTLCRSSVACRPRYLTHARRQ